MNLAELQRDFRGWLVDASEDAAQRIGIQASAGLFVYQNNYRAQLVGCIEQSYPQVRAWLGDETFLHAAISHIGRHPPHAWTLDVYADNFDATLAALYPNNPDLHELAWIENALTQSFVTADAEPVSLDLLATLDWDTARLRVSPSLKLHVLTTNADDIWTALNEEREPPEGEMLDAPAGVLVWRRQFVCSLNKVDALEYDALQLLQQNGSFAALCDMLVERIGETDAIPKAGALLAGWLGSELIVGVDTLPA